jgi:hypothetical protein
MPLELELLNTKPHRGYALVSHSLQSCVKGTQQNVEAGAVITWLLAAGAVDRCAGASPQDTQQQGHALEPSLQPAWRAAPRSNEDDPC